VYLETIAPVVSASVLGATVGNFVRARLAPPMAASAILAIQAITSPWGAGPFQAATAFGTLTGIERTPSRALISILGVTALAGLCGMAYTSRLRFRAARTLIWAAGMAIAVLVPVAVPWQEDAFRVTREQTRCTGSAPEVCGPVSRLKLLVPVQRSMTMAYHRLEGTAFVKPRAFTVTRLDHYSDLNGSAPLDFDPAHVHQGSYDSDALAEALMRPHTCADLFDAEDAIPILDAQDRVRPWMLAVLQGNRPALPVPDYVTDAFATIQNCSVFAGDLH
jgi:hypothetical protein